MSMIGKAEKQGVALAPVVGIGCPGLIREDGSIETGAQNLPGNWESSRFNLSNCIREANSPDRRPRDAMLSSTTTRSCRA